MDPLELVKLLSYLKHENLCLNVEDHKLDVQQDSFFVVSALGGCEKELAENVLEVDFHLWAGQRGILEYP